MGNSGIRAFLVTWGGQLVSLVGTAMTQFALTIWAWQITGQATALALVAFFSFGPGIILSPVAGALVDRWNRKWILMVSDTASGLVTLGLIVLYLTDHLAIWHLYVSGALSGMAQAFQSPAYLASITLMVPKEQYGRASGLNSLASSTKDIAGPVLAGILLPLIGLGGIMVVDVVTFLVAVGALTVVHIPQPEGELGSNDKQRSLWEEALDGFRYISGKPGLRGLLSIFFLRNLTNTFAWVVFIPMVLARTNNNTTVVGTLEAMLGVGGLMGALLMTAWGGPRRKVQGILGGMGLKSLFGVMLIGVGQGPVMWGAGAFFSIFFHPIMGGSSTALWQSIVPPELQGRVFATRRLISQVTVPVSLLLVGPVADSIFEPAMIVGGWLAMWLGWLVEPGVGAGMQVMNLVVGMIGVGLAVIGYAVPAIRYIESN